MKGISIFISIVFYVTVEVSSQGYVPSCTTSEMDYLWPNYNDNTMFWQCTEVNQPPIQRRCQDSNHWFSFYHQGCLHQDEWIGHPPMPSSTVTMTLPATTVSIPTASSPIPTAPTPASTTTQ